jgi:hypothetical protein
VNSYEVSKNDQATQKTLLKFSHLLCCALILNRLMKPFCFDQITFMRRRHVQQNRTDICVQLQRPVRKTFKLSTVSSMCNPLCLSSSSAHHFSDHSFCVHYPVNRDDRHLLAHAMVSDFSVARQFSQREQLFFCYGSKSMPKLKVHL